MRARILGVFCFTILFLVFWELLPQLRVGSVSQGGCRYSLTVQSSDEDQLEAFAESLYLEGSPLNLEYADGDMLRVVGLTLDEARNVRRAFELNIVEVQVEVRGSL